MMPPTWVVRLMQLLILQPKAKVNSNRFQTWTLTMVATMIGQAIQQLASGQIPTTPGATTGTGDGATGTPFVLGSPKAAVPAPTAPIMGGLHAMGSELVPFMGDGVPKKDWSGLKESAVYKDVGQLRPTNTRAAISADAHRSNSLSGKHFKRGDDVDSFLRRFSKMHSSYGTLAVAHLPDPSSGGDMLNVLTFYPRFIGLEIHEVTALVATLKPKWDEFDISNDRALTKSFLKSIDQSLQDIVETSLPDSDATFVEHLLIWLRDMRPPTLTQFDDLKKEIRDKKPTAYAGSNMQTYLTELKPKFDQLVSAGHMDYQVLLDVVETCSRANAGADHHDTAMYAHDIYEFHRKLTLKIHETLLLSYKDRVQAITRAQLQFTDLQTLVVTRYNHAKSSHRWIPATNPVDKQRPQGNNLEADADTSNRGGGGDGKRRNGKGNPKHRQPKGKSKLFAPPAKGESWTRQHPNGKTIHWCPNCGDNGWWTFSHTAKQHTDNWKAEAGEER